MVELELSAPLVSILVAITSCISELLLFKSLQRIISLREYTLLQNHRPVYLRAHVRRVRVAQFVLLICFIAIEIVFSSFSSTTTIKTKKDEACISLRLSIDTNSSEFVFPYGARYVFANCLSVYKDVASVYMGNLSMTSNKVICSDSAVYRFTFEKEKKLDTHGGTQSCSTVRGATSCAWVKKEGSTLWLSEQGGPVSLFDKEAFFSKTELFFDIDKNALQLLAKRMAANENTFGYFFRKNVLLDSVEDVCEFEYDRRQGTSVPNSVAVLLVVIWSTSIGAFCMSCFVVSRSLYDVSNAFDMVTRTVRPHDDQMYPIQNPAVFLLAEDVGGSGARFVLRNVDDVGSG